MSHPTARILTVESRDHLKSVHTFVQCERCPQTFEGTRAQRIDALDLHRCQAYEEIASRTEEGIRTKVWNQIEEMKNLPKDDRPKTPVEKWNLIWAVLFPGTPKPNNPCKLYIHFKSRELIV